LAENFSDLVSIVMPAWKAESHIADSIESVIAQTYQKWELIVVDDCSPDNTSLKVQSYSEQDSRIKLIKSKLNGGPANARNLALRIAKGRWIAFLDSDDVWDKEKLASQLLFHEDKRAVLTYTGFQRFAGNNRYGKVVQVPESLTYFELLGNTAIATSTVIVDRTISGDFLMKNIYYDDFGCWLDLLKGGQKAYGLQLCLMRYRVLAGSVSRNKIKSSFEVWKVYRKTESLGLLISLKYFALYFIHAVAKHSKF
jgi:teichuronic acid biosynthesis glycosyltransferase TuaG